MEKLSAKRRNLESNRAVWFDHFGQTERKKVGYLKKKNNVCQNGSNFIKLKIIIIIFQNGNSYGRISEILGIPKSIISYIIQKRRQK
jgi:hypothetical protein